MVVALKQGPSQRQSVRAGRNVGAPTLKVLLEDYTEDIVPVLPRRLRGLAASFCALRLARSKHKA
jgi:hypothetical protein